MSKLFDSALFGVCGAIASMCAAPAALAEADAFMRTLPSPIIAIEEQAPPLVPTAQAIAVSDAAVLDAIDDIVFGETVLVEGLPLPGGDLVDAELTRRRVFTRDATLMVDDRPAPAPRMLILGGDLVGADGDDSVYIAIAALPDGGVVLNGWIDRDGARTYLATGPDGSMMATPQADMPMGGELPDVVCGTGQMQQDERLLARIAEAEAFVAKQIESGEIVLGAACATTEVAVETDWEFTTLFGGNTDAAMAYIGTLMGALSEIYGRDFDTTVTVPFARVWSANNDPWNTSDAFDLLNAFRNYWNANMRDVARDAASMLSGRNLQGAGGVAWLGGLCDSIVNGRGYGLNGYLNGSFPYPIQDNHPGNWDLIVTSHELGHNFGAPHTHSLNPPVDRCDAGQCGDAFNGTIMSYCHICPGGVRNIKMNFHPRIQQVVANFLAGESCDEPLPGATIDQQPQNTVGRDGETVELSVTFDPPEADVLVQWYRDGQPVFAPPSPTLVITNLVEAREGVYKAIVTDNTCGDGVQFETDEAILNVLPVCIADWNRDDQINAADVGEYLSDYFQDLQSGTVEADVDGTFDTNSADVGVFLSEYFAQCG